MRLQVRTGFPLTLEDVLHIGTWPYSILRGHYDTPNQHESTMYRLTLGPRIIVGADLAKKNLLKKVKSATQARQPKTRTSAEPSFSRRSRNNLIKALNGLSKLPEVLLTLSYPDGVNTDPKQWKTDLDRLNRRLKYQFPESWWIWRIEPQGQSGKPHYHIVGSTGQRTDPHDLWKWLQERWCRIVGLDPKKDQFATNVKEIKGDLGKLERYISAPETGPYMGYREGWLKLTNRWGKMNGANIPVAALTSYEVGQETLGDIKDMVLGSIRTQIGELEGKLAAMTDTTAYRDRITLERAIKGKKDYIYRIRFTGDFFSILAPEHIELIQKMLEHRKANGTL